MSWWLNSVKTEHMYSKSGQQAVKDDLLIPPLQQLGSESGEGQCYNLFTFTPR